MSLLSAPPKGPEPLSPSSINPAYSIATAPAMKGKGGEAGWLALYFFFNLALTLFNKLVLQGFPFPWTLTAIQMLSGTVGTQIALQQKFFTQANLTNREGAVMVAFSILYTINIAVSNLSLHLVTIPVRFSPLDD